MVKDFPGPKSVYFLGCLGEFRGGLKALPDFLLTQSAKVIESGENVMRIWLGPILRLYVLDSDAAKVLTNSTVELEKGWDYDRVHDWIGTGLITSADETWRQSRKLLTPAFHFAKLDEYATIMDEKARILMDHLKSMTDGEEHNIYNSIKNTALDIIGETAMGIEMNAMQDPEQSYIKSISIYAYQSFWRGVSPLYVNDFAWWITGNHDKQQRALKILKAKSVGVIRERIKILKSGLEETKKRPDFLDLLLEAHRSGKMDFKQIQEEVDTFLFAGYDTTSHAIVWTLWCLATHAEWQEQVYKEIQETFGDSDAEFQSHKLKGFQILNNLFFPDLKVLNAVIKESMRIFAPVPAIERRLRNEVKIGKHIFPKGATVVIPLFLIHHNQKVFPRHYEFEPENFMNNNDYPSNAYIPFSAGLRNCIGQKFAMRQIRIIIAHFIYNYRFSTDHEFRDNKPGIEMVLVPSLGLPLKIEERRC
ncbi:hypothetical protein M3Y97_01029200 [Aphelenchoides bicaudatus]|nr:hypothetical protein M3Y97_01029200 [Aphelenchoides bicaudatus]